MSWRNQALEIAKQIRAEDPGMHKLRVATEIANRWRRNQEPCPSTPKLIRALREWEETGKLPSKAPLQHVHFEVTKN
jgi:hypothetical protein